MPVAHLEVTLLAAAPSFEALSYTWGVARREEGIRLNGVLVRTTENLIVALHSLRHPDRVRVLWVDALCINQENCAERSAQVAIMDRIYRRADKVLIWLGPAAPWIDDTFKGLETIAEWLWRNPSVLEDAGVIEYLQDMGVDHLSLARSVSKSGRRHSGPDEGEKFLKNFIKLRRGDFTIAPTFSDFGGSNSLGMDILALLKRDWWSRVWIVQEITLAREAVVVCGKHSTPWDVFTFVAAIDSLNWGSGAGRFAGTTARLASLGRTRLRMSRTVTPHPGRPPPEGSGSVGLLENLSLFRWSKATDARDKIFGLLGISNPTGIVADYSAPVSACFIAAAQHLLRSSGTLDLLDLTGSPYLVRQHQQLPSWVPDWGCYSRIPEFSEEQRIERTHAAALAIADRVQTASGGLVTASLESQVQFHGDTTLLLRGMCIDKVTELLDPLPYCLETDPTDTESMMTAMAKSRSLLDALRVPLDGVAMQVEMVKQETKTVSMLCSIADLAFSHYASLQPEPEDNEKFGRLISLLLHGGDAGRVEGLNVFQDRMAYRRPMPNLPDFLRRWCLTSCELGMKIGRMAKSGAMTVNYAELLLMNFGLRVTITRDERFCLTPAACRLGDQIALLRGGRKPYVVRAGTDKNQWMVVGPCFMDSRDVAKLREVWQDEATEEMAFE